MIRLKVLLLIIPYLLILNGCTTDSSSDLINDTITDEITYTKTIKSIIDNDRIVYHATFPLNGAPMSLVTYQNLRKRF